MKRLKKFLVINLTSLATFLFLPNPVWGSGTNPPTVCAVNGVFQSILKVSLGLAGVALFIMVIMNGFKWLTAGTNEKAVQEARLGMTYAMVGLALMIGAWFILRLIEIFTGITVTEFTIPTCT